MLIFRSGYVMVSSQIFVKKCGEESLYSEFLKIRTQIQKKEDKDHEEIH
jgi:hypothetical protein